MTCGYDGIGRFLSPDPLGHAASMSLYDYCAGDPVNGLDPTGRCLTKSLMPQQQLPTFDDYTTTNYNGTGFPMPRQTSTFRQYDTTNVSVGFEGSPNAYNPADPLGKNGALDLLQNAGSPGNWYGVATTMTGQFDSHGKDLGPTGQPLYNGLGNYVAQTGWTKPGTNGWNQSDYVNGAVVPAVSLSDAQRGVTASNPRGDMRYGDYVWVVNETTGLSSMAIYDDNRGNRSGVEVSSATANNVGIPYKTPGGGTTSNETIHMYVFPGSRNRGYFPGGN